jgi:hypothetical protein
MKDKQGRYRTESLFFETNRDRSRYPPLFTLKENEHNNLFSLYQLYMGASDPTEYTFAMSVFGSYAHWEKLCSLSWFRKHVDTWRQHLDAKTVSEQIELMKGMANEGNAAAGKWIATRGWEKTAVSVRRGRPNKIEVDRELKRRADHFESLEDDAKRMKM